MKARTSLMINTHTHTQLDRYTKLIDRCSLIKVSLHHGRPPVFCQKMEKERKIVQLMNMTD